jgi:hypothetical protein
MPTLFDTLTRFPLVFAEVIELLHSIFFGPTMIGEALANREKSTAGRARSSLQFHPSRPTWPAIIEGIYSLTK